MAVQSPLLEEIFTEESRIQISCKFVTKKVIHGFGKPQLLKGNFLKYLYDRQLSNPQIQDSMN